MRGHAHLHQAAAEQRLLVTPNVADFSLIHQQWARDGRTHSGIVLVTQKQFRQSRNLVGALVAALLSARDDHLLPAAIETLFLSPAAPPKA